MVHFSKTHSGYPASHRHNNRRALVPLTWHHSWKAITAFIVFHRKDKVLNIVWLVFAAYKNCRKWQALQSSHLPSPKAVHDTGSAFCYLHCKSWLFSINLPLTKDCYCYFSSQCFHYASLSFPSIVWIGLYILIFWKFAWFFRRKGIGHSPPTAAFRLLGFAELIVLSIHTELGCQRNAVGLRCSWSLSSVWTLNINASY